jgi:hypothetical protein
MIQKEYRYHMILIVQFMFIFWQRKIFQERRTSDAVLQTFVCVLQSCHRLLHFLFQLLRLWLSMLLAPNASNICCWRPLAATTVAGPSNRKMLES